MSTLDRLAMVVDCFRDTPRLTLGEVARRTGIPRSSVHRMLLKLVRMDWLRREGLEYEIGDKLGDLGAISLYRNKFERVVVPLLYKPAPRHQSGRTSRGPRGKQRAIPSEDRQPGDT